MESELADQVGRLEPLRLHMEEGWRTDGEDLEEGVAVQNCHSHPIHLHNSADHIEWMLLPVHKMSTCSSPFLEMLPTCKFLVQWRGVEEDLG